MKGYFAVLGMSAVLAFFITSLREVDSGFALLLLLLATAWLAIGGRKQLRLIGQRRWRRLFLGNIPAVVGWEQYKRKDPLDQAAIAFFRGASVGLLAVAIFGWPALALALLH